MDAPFIGPNEDSNRTEYKLDVSTPGKRSFCPYSGGLATQVIQGGQVFYHWRASTIVVVLAPLALTFLSVSFTVKRFRLPTLPKCQIPALVLHSEEAQVFNPIQH